MPVQSQQNVMLTQVLHCFTGIWVSFIVPIPPDPASNLARNKTEFAVHSQLERSLAELVRESLPLASHFVGIQQMVADTDDHGQVINALNGALSDLSHDFYVSRLQYW